MIKLPRHPSTRWLPRLRLGAVLLLLSGCQDGPSGPEEGGGAGLLTVSLTTPNPDDRAVVVTVIGPEPITSVETANPSYVVHSRITGNSVKAAAFGALSSGPLLRFSVPDVNKVASYSVAVVEVATATNGLRDGTTGYLTTLAK